MAEESFAQKYGGRSRAGAINYQERPRFSRQDLVVDSRDELEDIEDKLHNSYEIIQSGGSLAVALDMLPADGSAPTVTPSAVEGMDPIEREQWQDFLGGLSLPSLDIDKDKAKPEGGPSKEKRDVRRLQALQRLYESSRLGGRNPEELGRENLAFFQQRFDYLIPLLTAADKIIGAERAATGGGTRNARDLAELQAANLISTAAASRRDTILRRQNETKKNIAYFLDHVLARKVAMQPEPEGGRQKARIPLDEQRQKRGKDRIGAPRTWNREGASGRVQALGEGLAQTIGAKRRRIGDNAREGSQEIQNPYNRMPRGGAAGVGGSGRRRTPFTPSSEGRQSPRYRPQSPIQEVEEGPEDVEM